MAQEATVIIDRFLGLRQDNAGDLTLEVGELAECKNIRITDNYKMRKREGYVDLFTTAIGTAIRGMWYGKLANTYRTVFSCGGYIYSKDEIAGTDYDSIDTASYTHVDVIKTTAYASATAGTTGADGMTIVVNSDGTQRTEVTQANIDLVASIGKYYYHTDKTVWLIVAKSDYASIALARTGLATTTVYYRIGSCADARTYFFAFNDKLYIQDGTSYKYWSGSANVADVAGYIPKVAIATPPAGGGTPYEDINTLTGKKHQTFNGDGSATAYYLAETTLTSIDSVYVGGVLQTLTTHYTVNATTGVVTFISAPATGVDNVDIYWTKGTGTRTTVTAHKQSILFGGANDSRVFMYGVHNKVIYSALADGVPSAEYFPENNFLLVGSDEYDVTGLSKQYDRLVIHKEKDTHYSTYEFDATLGTSFPTYPLNDVIGNIAFGEVRSVLNNPFTVNLNSVYQFAATNVRDEKNAVLMSDRVRIGLDALDLTTAITFDWEKNFEYWVFVGNKGYIYNYKIDVWYYFELYHTPTCFIEIDGECYFGTSTGLIMKFDTGTFTDNGNAVSAKWETGFLSFGVNYIRKFLTFGWVGLQPETKSYCDVTWESDRDISPENYVVSYNLFDFGDVDFGDFEFNTNYNPQPFRLKFKIKKFCYVKFIGINDKTDKAMTILNLNLPALLGGMSK